MFGELDWDGDRMREFLDRQRGALAEAWNLADGGTVRADLECERERLRTAIGRLPEGREVEARGRDLDEYEHRLDLCGQWDLEPMENWKLDSFIHAMAWIEIERRLKAHWAEAKRRRAERSTVLSEHCIAGRQRALDTETAAVG